MKHLNGELVTNRVFRDALVDRVGVRGITSAAQLVEDLGITDAKEKHALSVMMVDLTKHGVLVRETRGRYCLHPSYKTQKSRSTEDSIAAVITQYGGLATTVEVLEAFKALPSQNKEMRCSGRGNSAERQIRRELQNSPAFRNVFLRRSSSYWALKDDLILQIPISGRTVEVLANHQFQDATEWHEGGDQAAEELKEDIDAHFIRVGRALRRVRRLHGCSLDDIAAVPEVDEAAEWARWRSPELSQEVRTGMKSRAKERAEGEAAEIGSVRHEAILDEEELRYTAFALDLMESGSAAAHRAMPVAIYYLYADRFGLCPASLSRGVVHGRVLDERHQLLKSRWGWLP